MQETVPGADWRRGRFIASLHRQVLQMHEPHRTVFFSVCEWRIEIDGIRSLRYPMIGSTRSRTLPLWYPPFPAPMHDLISSRDSMRRQGCSWCSHPVGRDCTILAATDANLHPTKKERSTFVGGALLDVFPAARTTAIRWPPCATSRN